MEQVTVRRATPADEDALASLATLDSARAPSGAALVAESDGRILAALPLDGGRAVADPFEPTAELLDMLELRAAQLRRREGRPRRRGLGGLARVLAARASAP